MHGTDFAKSTLQRYTQELGAQLRKSFVKPSLTDSHKLNRLDFVLGKLEPDDNNTFRVRDLSNVLHLDEKWFYAILPSETHRMFPREDRHPSRTTRHKSHITKVMFIAVVGYPHDAPGHGYFDGKIGLFPVGETQPAARASKNRPKGELVWRDFTLNAHSYLALLTQEGGILSEVKRKMPWMHGRKLYIQHNGAPAHIADENQYLLSCAGKQDGWDIEFQRQPAQSPDLNKLDLCLFNSMQRQADMIRSNGTNTREAIIQRVQEMWTAYEEDTLSRAHALLLRIYQKVLEHGGGNQFEIPRSETPTSQFRRETINDFRISREVYLHAIQERDTLQSPRCLPEYEEEIEIESEEVILETAESADDEV